jgi:hypothetical protein
MQSLHLDPYEAYIQVRCDYIARKLDLTTISEDQMLGPDFSRINYYRYNLLIANKLNDNLDKWETELLKPRLKEQMHEFEMLIVHEKMRVRAFETVRPKLPEVMSEKKLMEIKKKIDQLDLGNVE